MCRRAYAKLRSKHDNWSSTWIWRLVVLGTSLGSTLSLLPRFLLPPPGGKHKLCSTAFTGEAAGNGDVCLVRDVGALTYFQFSNIGSYSRWKARVLTFATRALLGSENFGLAPRGVEQISGQLSKKLPPAAEFKRVLSFKHLSIVKGIKLVKFRESYDVAGSEKIL
ncbi:hypothetical protein Tco_0019397 [Tanacetum coccineum]